MFCSFFRIANVCQRVLVPVWMLLFPVACSCTQHDTDLKQQSVDSVSAVGFANMLFIGYMMQYDAQIMAAENADSTGYDCSSYFQHVGTMRRQADHAICNFEVTLAGKLYKNYPLFSAPNVYLDAIIDAYCDVFLTANNHCLNRGRRGLDRTIAKMWDAHVAQFGTYEDSFDRVLRYPALTECNGVKIVFLNYSYGTNGLKPSTENIVNYIDTVQIDVDTAKVKTLKPLFIIACVYWGVEGTHKPNEKQRDLARWMIAEGEDHINGGHSHCVQPAEIVFSPDSCKRLVTYSLGNVVSNMSNSLITTGKLWRSETPLQRRRMV